MAKNETAKYQFPKSRIVPSDMLCREMKRLSDMGIRFCFILGSGASVESKIPSGQKMEKVWMDYIMSHNPQDFEVRAEHLLNEKEISCTFTDLRSAWKKADAAEKAGKWEPIPSSYYFDIYKLRFYTYPLEGYRYLEEVMEGRDPSLGYHALARLLTQDNRHNLVITTNFDSLTEDAVFLYSRKRPLVASHESLASYVELDAKRPVVAKVHRDAMCHPFNEQENTNALKDQWRTTLNKVFSTYVPVVVGYEGGDRSLMAFLQEEEQLSRGIYWCYWEPGGNLPDEKILKFLKEKKGWLVPISGFDGLMMELFNTMFPDDPITPSSTQAHLKQQHDARYKLYDDRWKEFKENPHYQEIATHINELDEASRQEREETNTQTSWDYIRRGDQLAEEGRYEEALAEYWKAIQLDPTNAEVYYHEGVTYDKMEKFQEAIVSYDQALMLNPYNKEAYYNRGTVYGKLEKFSEALNDFSRAIQLDPGDSEVYCNRGLTYENMGEFRLAIADYNLAISLDPTDPKAYYNRGNAYGNLGEFQKAIGDYDRAILLNPSFSDAYNNRGNTYQKAGKFQEALADFNKAIQLNPNLPEPYFNRGVIFVSMGKFWNALENYSRAIHLNPNYSKAYNGRGIVYDNLGKFQEAMADFDRAILLNPNFPDAYTGYGVVCANTGRFQEAIENFSTAIEMPPPHALSTANLKISLLNRAKAYRSIGKEAKAQADEARANSL